jgi:integrase
MGALRGPHCFAASRLLRSVWYADRERDKPERTELVAPHPNVGNEFRTAVKATGFTYTTGRPALHSLRHTYASLLIASGLDVVFVSDS